MHLIKIRKASNLSAYELSLKLGKDASYIHKVKKGYINIGIKTVFEICEILKIKPEKTFK